MHLPTHPPRDHHLCPERLEKAWSREHSRFAQAYNERLLNGLVSGPRQRAWAGTAAGAPMAVSTMHASVTHPLCPTGAAEPRRHPDLPLRRPGATGRDRWMGGLCLPTGLSPSLAVCRLALGAGGAYASLLQDFAICMSLGRESAPGSVVVLDGRVDRARHAPTRRAPTCIRLAAVSAGLSSHLPGQRSQHV